MSVGFAGGAIGAFTGTASHESVPRVEWHVSIHGEGGQLLLDSNHDEVVFGPARGEMIRVDLPPGAGIYDPRGPIRELLSVAKGGAPTDSVLNTWPGLAAKWMEAHGFFAKATALAPRAPIHAGRRGEGVRVITGPDGRAADALGRRPRPDRLSGDSRP